MSLYLQVDDDEPEHIASHGGASSLREWANTNRPLTSELRHLFDHGWSQEPKALASEIGQILDTTDLDAGLRDILQGLRELCMKARTVVTLTQGFAR